MTELVEVWINGRWPLLMPEHRAVRPEWHYWEAARLASMWHHLALDGGPQTVFDIGSEEGDLSALYAAWGCDVLLVEPNPKAWPCIRLHFEANGLTDRVVGTFEGFAAAEPGGMLRTADYGVGASWPDSADGPIDTEHGFLTLHEYPNVQRTTIDLMTLAFSQPPTAITIDVEGAELQVLLGAHKTLRKFRPLVWVSLHPDFMWALGDDPADLFDLMADHNYEPTFLADDHEQHFLWTPR